MIFRVVQESLTSLHRHAGSPQAKIYLAGSPREAEFEISDSGSGIAPQKSKKAATASGVGVRGMEERVRQFGGTLQIVSNAGGTRVLVKLPIESHTADFDEQT